jgi:CMP-N-acetylneuraminic acid synthetase
MIVAILIGRDGSVGIPKKNVHSILNRPLMSYPLLAAQNSKFVDEVYVSTDSKDIIAVGKSLGAKIIDRPKELATSEAIVEDAYVHAYEFIKNKTKEEIELVVLLMCNAVSILPETIDKGIETLREKNDFDSAVTVSGYNMYTPVRARKIAEDGSLISFVPLEMFNFKIDSNRQKQDTVYFHDCGVSIVRPKCLENISEGLLPQKWMGKKIYPLVQEGVLDVDLPYELPIAENWLKTNNFTKDKLPYKLKVKK